MLALAKSSLAPDVSPESIHFLRQKIEAEIRLFSETSDSHKTPVPALSMAIIKSPRPPAPYLYEPSLCVCVRGTKEVVIGEQSFTYDQNHFLLTCIGLPTLISVPKASPLAPYAALQIVLDLEMAGDIITQMGLYGTETERAEPGLAVRPLTASLLEPVYRLVSLVRTPQDIPILHEVFHREILYRLLTHPIGDRLRRIVQQGSQTNKISKAVSWLRQNYAKQVSIDELAEVAGMAASTLHRHFREVTTLSPLQYQKKLRLQEARHLMLVDGLDTITTAYTVGYESVTQFNREYRRLFGQPPARDTKALRESTGLVRAMHI